MHQRNTVYNEEDKRVGVGKLRFDTVNECRKKSSAAACPTTNMLSSVTGLWSWIA